MEGGEERGGMKYSVCSGNVSVWVKMTRRMMKYSVYGLVI